MSRSSDEQHPVEINRNKSSKKTNQNKQTKKTHLYSAPGGSNCDLLLFGRYTALWRIPATGICDNHFLLNLEHPYFDVSIFQTSGRACRYFAYRTKLGTGVLSNKLI